MKCISGIIFPFLFLLLACQTQKPVLEKLSYSNNDLLKPVFSDPENYELQIIYTQIDRKENGEINFRDITYRIDPELYFYPASTVKLPIAILALEKMKALNENNPSLDRNTPYKIAGDTTEHSVAADVEAIFAVSDNEAFNRLFEFLGQDHINRKLREKGLDPVRISHRLSTANSLDTETKKIVFQPENDKEDLFFENSVTQNQESQPLKLKSIKKGKGYLENDSLVEQPFNFALKNYFPLQVQHQLMKQLWFPEEFPESKRFDLSKEDRQFLEKAMSQLPREAGYDPEEYNDSYVKFFLYGDSKDPVPGNVKIYNKVGFAYGTLTETAYIKDESRKVEFLLSATLLVNKNGTFNYNNYEYDSIGIPFLAALGREIYQLELNRKKN